ncbi:hypothetical protein H0H92_006941 [Tricholoma furcatifolium]|nr:hypothetical protein H0H92_006941 [Tricholoma furcatifolium]
MPYSIFWAIVLAYCYGVVLVQADVFPDYPAGDLQTTGQTCRIAWQGDTNSTTAWKDMTIELMTGDNYDMVHLTTVATGQDGTVDGSYSWTCPGVTPNAAIYFYQFRSPHTSNYEWTTRFAIASSSGQVTSPPNSTQPDGAQIPWGTGALLDPSIAVPAPTFTTTATTSTTATSTATKPPTVTATPTNVAPGVIAGCTSFFTDTNLLCYEIAADFGITVDDFEAWNGGSNACNVLEPGLAYCVAAKPSNVAPGAISTCTSYFTETDLLCYEIATQFSITVEQFEAWNGGSSVCNVLESGVAYCVAAPTTSATTSASTSKTTTSTSTSTSKTTTSTSTSTSKTTSSTTTSTTTTTTAAASSSTPTNVASGVVAGCTKFFTETDLLCYEIATNYGITVDQFEAWNGGSTVCNVLESGKAYCVAGTTTTTAAPAVATPTNVASGVVSGCTAFFTETTLLCYEIASNYGITVDQFEAWNGAEVCNVLVTGDAYCVAGP